VSDRHPSSSLLHGLAKAGEIAAKLGIPGDQVYRANKGAKGRPAHSALEADEGREAMSKPKRSPEDILRDIEEADIDDAVDRALSMTVLADERVQCGQKEQSAGAALDWPRRSALVQSHSGGQGGSVEHEEVLGSVPV
jgi:hypothetical protein